MKSFFRALKLLIFIVILGGSIYLYGTYIEPKNLTVHEYKITNKNITNNFDGFKIVQVSDILYGNTIKIKELKKIVSAINEQKPDAVVLTGDLIHKNAKMNNTKAEKIASELSKISANSGKYAISGDNDTLFDEWDNIIDNSGFINLNDNYDTIYKNGYNFLLIAGVSSFQDKESIINKNQKSENFINSFEKDGPIYKILLMHEPDYIDELENNPYDLILAGHSLAGQVKIPFVKSIITTKGAKKYTDGHYKIDSADLYVSNGIGTNYFNFRFCNTPSISVYRLITK